MTTPCRPNLIRAAARDGAPAFTFHHPLNPASEVHMTSFGDAVGLERLGVWIMRLPPGKESFVYHAHYTEEEFVYVLSGRGIADVDDAEVEIGPGDFLGFPTPSVPHLLRNPFDEDLVYLSAGERNPSEIAEFPRLGKRLVRVGMAIAIHSLDGAITYPGFAPLSPDAARASLAGAAPPDPEQAGT